MEKNFQNYRNEYSPNFVKVEPPTGLYCFANYKS